MEELMKELAKLCEKEGISEYVFAAAKDNKVATRWSVSENKVLKEVVKLLLSNNLELTVK